MNRRIRIRTHGGVEAEFGRLDSAIRLNGGPSLSTVGHDTHLALHRPNIYPKNLV
jgi:hypothetical protein